MSTFSSFSSPRQGRLRAVQEPSDEEQYDGQATQRSIRADDGAAAWQPAHWVTMPEHTPILGNFPNTEVPAALGDKTIHPFSDFLLHDVGTGGWHRADAARRVAAHERQGPE